MEQNQTNGSFAALNDVINFNTQELNTLVLDLTGTFSATIVIEYTINGKDYYTLPLTKISDGSSATSLTAVGRYKADVSAYAGVRAKCTAYTSGTPAIAMRAVEGGAGILTHLLGAIIDAWNSTIHALTFYMPAQATGGYTPGHLISAATNNATNIKPSAGTLGYITASNINASPRYLKIYNKASAPSPASDTPVHTFLIPGNTAGAGTNIPIPSQGINLDTGISFAIVAGAADNDNTSVAASEIIFNYGYK